MQLIVPHTNTDLDALGAAVGAQVLYPQAVIVLPGRPNSQASEFISLHRYCLTVRTIRDIDMASVERLIVVDTADPARIGPLQVIAAKAEIHLYDHHPSEPHDLQARLEVRDLVGATSTLITELLEEAGAPLTPLQATALLSGIYADTGSLSFAGTTDRDARAAAFLLARGANLRVMAAFVQGNLSLPQQALLQALQARKRSLDVHGVRILLLEGETPEYVGGLSLVVHRCQDLLPAPALFAAVKMADRVHLVGRSEVPWVDAAAVMAAFGGGGHRMAAAAVVKGASLGDIVARLEALLSDLVQHPPVARDVMATPVKSVTPDLALREAERLMLRHGHTGLPVVDRSGLLQGMISLRDVEKARRHGLEHSPVKGIMVHKVVKVSPDTTLEHIQGLMVEKDIGRVPVVEGDHLIGIISRSDLLGLLYGGPAPRWHKTLYAKPDAHQSLADERERMMQAASALSPCIQALLATAGQVAASCAVSVFVVGGFVRDLLLGHKNLDIDIVAEGDGLAYARALAAALNGRVVEVPRFGTAHIELREADEGRLLRVDIATARREYYEYAAALPQVEHADLREDLYRRDFTINAMAIRLSPSGLAGLVDFFGGLHDLDARQIRILHTLSFVEDPTRIIRAVRFAHRYGFHLDAETAVQAAQAVADGFLDRVSLQRRRNELLLLLHEVRCGGALAHLHEIGALERLLPGVAYDQVACRAVDQIDALQEKVPDIWEAAIPWVAKLLYLLHLIPLSHALTALDRLRLRREQVQSIGQALEAWSRADTALSAPGASPAAVVSLLRTWSPEGLLLLCLKGHTEAALRYWCEWRHVRLQINGADLIRSGITPGPAVGRALARVLAVRLNGDAPDRTTQLALALRYAQEEA